MTASGAPAAALGRPFDCAAADAATPITTARVAAKIVDCFMLNSFVDPVQIGTSYHRTTSAWTTFEPGLATPGRSRVPVDCPVPGRSGRSRPISRASVTLEPTHGRFRL